MAVNETGVVRLPGDVKEQIDELAGNPLVPYDTQMGVAEAAIRRGLGE